MTNHPTTKLGRLGQAALAAAEAGHYVFPLHPRTKFPAVEKWEQAATRDPEQIRQWWSARPYNLGIATGPSGLVVVDLDDAHGEPAPEPWTGATGGRDVLARLAAKAGQPVPAGTYTVSTPTVIHGWYSRSQPQQGRGSRGGPEFVVAGLSAGRQRRGAVAGRSPSRRLGGSQ